MATLITAEVWSFLDVLNLYSQPLFIKSCTYLQKQIFLVLKSRTFARDNLHMIGRSAHAARVVPGLSVKLGVVQ